MRFIVCCALLFLAAVLPCQAAPQLHADSFEQDLGTMYSGESRDHRFLLSNHGDSALVISNVRSSCGCTAAIVSQKTLPPGAQTELLVRFNSKNFQGRIVKQVVVSSNDGAAQHRFTLRASVCNELGITPPRLNFGTVAAGEVVTQPLLVTNHSDQPLHIKAARSTAAHLSLAALPESLAPGEQLEVLVTLRAPQQKKEVLNGYLLIEAQGHTSSQARIPVLAKGRSATADSAAGQ